MPAASVIIPVFARSHDLRRLLASLGTQAMDVRRLEVLVIENKRPLNKCWLSAGGWPFDLGYAYVRRGSQATCRNLGARLARGPRLVFLDSDVVLTADTLPRLLADVESSDHAIVMADVADSPGAELTLATRLFDVPAHVHKFRCDKARGPLTFKQFVSCAFAIHRDEFGAVGGFAGTFVDYGYEDVEFAFRAQRAGLGFDLSDRATVTHHKHLTPSGVLARARALGRSAAHFVALHPEIEQIMPLGVQDTLTGVLAYPEGFGVDDLTARAEAVEAALVRSRSPKARDVLLAEGTPLYDRIALYGRYVGIRDGLTAAGVPLGASAIQAEAPSAPLGAGADTRRLP